MSNLDNQNKGVFKLKFYCEMCKKQCKDENGFKQHCKTEYHQQQMILYAQNASAYIEKFSNEFEKEFMEILKRFYSNQKVLSNKVYKDYIRDKDNVHMNSTKWATLGIFIDYLVSKNKIIQEQSEQGPLITYIDKSPQAILEQKKIENYEKNQILQKQVLEQRQIQRQQRIIQHENIFYDKKKAEQGEIKSSFIHNIKGELPDDININIEIKSKQNQNQVQKQTSIFQIKAIENQLQPKIQDDESVLQKREASSDIDFLLKELKNNKQVKKNFDQIEKNIQQIKPKMSPGIIVKILKSKGIIKRIYDEYQVEVQILNSQEIQIVKQSDLQTVIPKIDGTVMVLKQGQYYQKIGIIEGIQKDNFSAAIQLLDENICLKLKYDEFSKIP